MLRSICALSLVAAIASAARGATLPVTPDKFTYNVGETITLTVIGDSQGTKGALVALGLLGLALARGLRA